MLANFLPMTKVAIIGTGFGAKVHVPGWKKIRGTKVQIWTGRDWKKAVNDANIELISIATPPFIQKKITLAAIKNKKIVLLEKPAGLNVQEAREIAMVSQKHSGLVAIDFELRFIPHFNFLKDLLQKKVIGDIRTISIRWVTGGRAGTKITKGWSNYTKTGGGVLLNYGSHILDYVTWLFGDFNTVLGKLEVVKKVKEITPPPDADDTVTILGNLKNKIPVTIFISNVLHNGSGHSIEIFGSTGTIVLKNPNVFDAVRGFTLFKTNTKGELTQCKVPTKYGKISIGPDDGRIKPFQTLAETLINTVKNKNRVISSLPMINDAVKVHEVMSAILKSNRSKQWEKVGR